MKFAWFKAINGTITTILTIVLHRRYYDTEKISSISIIVTPSISRYTIIS